jgi:hypothetical protein
MRGGPTIKALEDVPAQEMWRFEFEDGRTASIWEKWIEMSPRFSAFWNRWDPGAMNPSHGHQGDHSILVLQGEVRCGDVLVRAGGHVMLEWGDTFGPWEAGPEGCELYGFIAGDGTPFPGDRDAFERLLAARGARVVPLPMPSGLPPWQNLAYTAGSVTSWGADAGTSSP